MLLQRILQTSFFEWSILWLVTFLSGVSVFILTTKENAFVHLHNNKLPGWRNTNEPHLGYANKSTSGETVSKCNPYGLVTANKLSQQEAFARLASKDKLLILSYVDMGFVDIVENFIETSVARFNLTNVLFFSSSVKACHLLERRLCRACYVSQGNGESEQQSAFGSKEFISKMNIRTRMVHSALKEGYDVIHTDTDVVFLHSPIDDIKSRCFGGHCDVAPLWDHRSHNAGFLFIRSTENSQKLYNRMIELAETFPNIDDQRILNAAIEELSTEMPTLAPDVQAELQEEEEFVDPDKLDNMDALLQGDTQVTEKPVKNLLQVVSLPSDLYLSGQAYFVQGQRHFATDHPCKTCLVVHNNWLIEKSSKIWRFKENHMWMVDTNGYYSNLNAKYLTMDNNIAAINDGTTVSLEDVEEDGEEFDEKQQSLLENGFRLARCLNRTLILPKMFLNRFSPPFPAWFAHEKLLGKLIERYAIDVRESTFLSHPKVPMNIKKSVSVPIKLAMPDLTDKELALVKDKRMLQYRPRNNVLGPNKVELASWFSAFHDIKVIRFDSVWEDLSLLDLKAAS